MKSARLLGFVALAVVIVIGLWVTSSRPRAIVEHAPVAEVESAARAAAELVTPASETVVAARTAADAAIAPVAARPDSTEDWIVVVVDGSTNEPVAGAEVVCTNKRVKPSDSRRPLLDFDPESVFDVRAEVMKTDERGRARFGPDALPGMVCARRGAAFGSTSVSGRAAATVQVTIQRALHVEIQVVDARGQPVAGVPVSLRAADAVQGMQPIWTGITAGTAGIARARHFQRGLARLKSGFELVAGFEFPTRTASTLPMDIEHLPLEPLRLVLPATGSVEVSVRDSLGGLLLPTSVQLNETTAGEDNFTVTPHLRQFEAAIVEKGLAIFPFVETGLQLTAQAAANMTLARISGPGPRVAGERVLLEIDAGPPRPLLVGRLVDETRAPIADADVQCGMEFKSGAPEMTAIGGMPVTTSATGRFEILSLVPADVPIRATLSFKAQGFARGAGGIGSVRIDTQLHNGENDLGEIVVRVPFVLVTGNVVDEQGASIGNARIDVEVESRQNGSLEWVRLAEMTAKSDDSGAFKVMSTLKNPTVRLSAKQADFVQLAPVQVPGGARDVKIVLAKASVLAGSFIVEPDIHFTDITVYVRALTEPELTWQKALHNERVHLGADGTFRMVDVRPLVVDLLVRRPGMKEPLVAVPNLDLRGGGTAKDPRLVGIDLRGRLLADPRQRKVDTLRR